jgi:hypothetical protein
VDRVVTHYYLAGRRPFLNLSDLDDASLDAVLRELNDLRGAGKQHRPFGPRYMVLRRHTEARLRQLFIARGGKPARSSPHYFVLGESAWYEKLAPRTEHVQLPLSALPSDKTSVTYPDSFMAMGFGPEVGLIQESRPYHGKVFLLGELPRLIERYGIPSPSSSPEREAWTSWPREAYIEVQLWSDDPVRPFLKGT